MAHSTKVITDESQVPAGYVRICDVTPDATLQRRISHAHMDGTIQAVKLMRSVKDTVGPVWVERAGALKLLETRESPTVSLPLLETHRQLPVSAEELVLYRIALALEKLVGVSEQAVAAIERLAGSAELLATTPEEIVS
jgi:hypothetical protein